MLFASLAPVALYHFAKRNFSTTIALTSSLLLTFSYLLQYYSHDCRAYSLFLLLGILSIHYYLETVIVARKTSGKTILFILSTTLLIYTHYFGFFILFFQGLHLLIFFRGRILVFSGYYFLILLLYIPHLYPFLTRAGDSVGRGTWIESPQSLEGLYNSLWVFSNFPFITVGCIIILVAALIKFISRPKIPENFHAVSLVVFWFLFAYLGMFIISFWVPMYIHRYLIYALPAYYITICLCVMYLFQAVRYQHILLGALVFCFACTQEYSPDKKQPISDAVTTIKENKRPETTVLVYPYDLITVFSYNYDQNAFSLVSDNRQFYMLDSSLKSQKIYHIWGYDDLMSYKQRLTADLIYFASGEQRNNFSDPVYKFLTDSFDLRWQKKTGANWFIIKFTSKKGVAAQ